LKDKKRPGLLTIVIPTSSYRHLDTVSGGFNFMTRI
jgi:hypothetical protein